MLDHLVVNNCSHCYAPISPFVYLHLNDPFFFQFNGALTDFLGKIKLTRSKTSLEVESEVAQSCPTLCNPMDCSLPGSSIHGILQARVLDWVAISFSRGSSQPRDRTWVSRIVGRCFMLLLSHFSRVQLCATP